MGLKQDVGPLALLYSGSMVGAGALAFAVMGYVIANSRRDREVGVVVELNPRLLETILGEPLEDVEKVIEFLCSPDHESRSKEAEGRRLIRLGQFSYKVVNGEKYRALEAQERRRAQLREAKRRERAKNVLCGTIDE